MKKTLLALSGCLLFFACQQEMDDHAPPKDTTTQSATRAGDADGMIVLGQQLENPYSVDNMQEAFNSLKMRRSVDLSEMPDLDEYFTATHAYVRFHPKTQEELAQLKADSTLILYEYPLDYEILEGGSYYHDPSIPDSLPTYQYTAVNVKDFAKIRNQSVEYQILETLFIPDEEPDEATGEFTLPSGQKMSEQLVSTLVDTSFEITGNLEAEVGEIVSPKTRSGKWRPAGRIMYKSETKGWIGLEGIKVKARRWFTTHTGIVNADGYYSCDGRFKRPANYHFDFERYDFEVRRTALATATYDGPKKTGSWDVWIDSSKGLDFFRATIFRAAHYYYHKDIGGLHRPPQNGTFKSQLKIRAYYEKNDNINGNTKPARRFLGLGSMIKIYNPQNGEIDVFATTIHELAHAAHWGSYKTDYNNADDFVSESWAKGVQYYLTRQVYSNYTTGFAAKAYTGVVIDLVDKADITKYCSGYYEKVDGNWEWYAYQDADGNNISKLYNDQVAGYTLPQIEASLKGSQTARQWETNLKNKYDNETERYLAYTFVFWSTK